MSPSESFYVLKYVCLCVTWLCSFSMSSESVGDMETAARMQHSNTQIDKVHQANVVFLPKTTEPRQFVSGLLLFPATFRFL